MLTAGVLTNQKAIVFWLKMSRFVCWPSLYYRSSFVSRLTLQIKFANGRMGLGEKIPYMHPMLVICTHPINNKTTISMFTLPTENSGGTVTKICVKKVLVLMIIYIFILLQKHLFIVFELNKYFIDWSWKTFISTTLILFKRLHSIRVNLASIYPPLNQRSCQQSNKGMSKVCRSAKASEIRKQFLLVDGQLLIPSDYDSKE